MDVLMPQLGETVAEGKIVVWYKAVGDFVSPGESLFEIETDKTSMEVPTTVQGVLSEIRVGAGDTVPVGAVVAVISAAAAAHSAPGRASGGPGAKVSADPFNAVRTPARNFGRATRRDGVKMTPSARRLASEAGLQIDALVGSGPHGHVLARDVRAAADKQGAARPERASPGLPAQAAERPRAPAPLNAEGAAGEIKEIYKGVPFQEIPLDGMRRTIARRLLAAKSSIPHFYLSMEVAMGRLMALRSEWNAQAQEERGVRLTLNDFIIKALALALQRVPEANAVWAEDSVLRFRHSDLAVAMAVEDGLYAPVIRQAELKSLGTISGEVRALVERARNRRLQPEDYRGGSMTVSNLGMHGVGSFAAIVNPPQSAILAVGACERRPAEAGDGSVRFVDCMTVTLSCDHRVIDGVLAARLLGCLKGLLQTPLKLLA